MEFFILFSKIIIVQSGKSTKNLSLVKNIIEYDISVNCNWVVTRWAEVQYTFTHKQYIERYKTNNT
jgi:hypothetical protein